MAKYWKIVEPSGHAPRGAQFKFYYWHSGNVTIREMANGFKTLPMTGFEPRSSGIESDHSANWATTTAPGARQFTFRVCSLFLSFPPLLLRTSNKVSRAVGGINSKASQTEIQNKFGSSHLHYFQQNILYAKGGEYYKAFLFYTKVTLKFRQLEFGKLWLSSPNFHRDPILWLDAK